MMELIAIGTSPFLPGFALVGVDTRIATSGEEALTQARAAPRDAILIVEERLIRAIDGPDRLWLETSSEPVIIALGADDSAQSDRLRRAIRATLGVDLLAEKGAS